MQEKVLNQTITCNDCMAEMKSMPDQSVDVVITSPPYNLKIKYNQYKDNLDYEKYLNWIFEVSNEIKRILKEDGSFFINVGSSCINPYISLDVCGAIRKTGLILQNNITWVKSITIPDKNGNLTSYGHFKPIPGNRFINQQFEAIFHFTKTGEVPVDRLAIGVPYTHKSNISRWKGKKIDCRCRGNIWFVPYKTTQKKKEHPAGFPVQLPKMCIKLAGIKSDMIVLDPFLGAGTTLIACEQLGITGIGIELDKDYCKMAKDRLLEEKNNEQSNSATSK